MRRSIIDKICTEFFRTNTDNEQSEPILKVCVIKYGVKHIPRHTFHRYYNLENIIIPETVITIGKRAFAHCKNLKSIIIPEGTTIIDAFAFAGCTNLEHVQLPNSLTTIEDCAFMNCTNLKSIVLPKNLKKLGSKVFIGTQINTIQVTEDELDVVAPPSKKEKTKKSHTHKNKKGKTKSNIDELLYGDPNVLSPSQQEHRTATILPLICSDIKWSRYTDNEDLQVPVMVTIKDDTVRIPRNAFRSCHHLKSVIMPDTGILKEIGSATFENCYALESITIPEGVIVIEKEAFKGCMNLKSVQLPKSLQRIEDEAFFGCINLQKCNLHPGIKIGNHAFTRKIW